MKNIPPAEYPIETEFPDTGPYRAGNTGIDWITCFDSGKAGTLIGHDGRSHAL